MGDGGRVKRQLNYNWLLVLVPLVLWTLLFGGDLAWELHQESRKSQELATLEARASFNKDKALRLWATSHGGVYVPVSERTPPNRYLAHLAERDIQTPSGKKLTLMNPAYLLRQVMHDYAQLYGIRGKITSLKPLNPDNAPDPWERAALLAFSRGVQELVEISPLDGEDYLRLMQPLQISPGCLKCHAQQGYRLGDLRGGISIATPMAPYLTLERQAARSLILSHGLVWALVVGAILLVSRHNHLRLSAFMQLQQWLLNSKNLLSHERQRLHEIIAGTNVGTWEWHLLTGRIVVNKRTAEMVGYSLDELEPVRVGTWQVLLHPDDLPITQALLQKNFAGELDYYECEVRLRHKNGDWIWVMERGKVVKRNEAGKPLRMAGTHTDVTERKRADAAIRTALTEKEVLLREVHHRVKNNLQITSSLLRLQARSESPEIARALEETGRRIKVMAHLHENLYQSADLQHVDPHEFLRGLIEDLKVSQSFPQIPHRFRIDIEQIRLSLDQVILVGQIFSELLSNIVKHAFPDGRSGEIVISLRRTGNGQVELVVADNGIGLREDFADIKSGSLGWQLVEALAGKLAAHIELERASGTRVRLLFQVVEA